MPSYIQELSRDDFEILEEIFVDKYNKFLKLYWMINSYSDYISELNYNSSEKNELSISMHLVKLKPDKVLKELTKSLDDDSDVLIWNEKKVIHILITDNDEEEEEPE